MNVPVALTRRQAHAVLAAQLSVGHGVRRSADLIEAERRIKDACRAALEAGESTPRRQCRGCGASGGELTENGCRSCGPDAVIA